MARRKLNKRNIRNIQRSHGTYYISIPIGIMRLLKWQDRQKVVVNKLGKKLVISNWPARRSLGAGGGK